MGTGIAGGCTGVNGATNMTTSTAVTSSSNSHGLGRGDMYSDSRYGQEQVMEEN